MTTKILPIHVLYQGVIEKQVRNVVAEVSGKLKSESFPFEIKFGFISLGKSSSDLLSIPLRNIESTPFLSDFGGALSQVLVDYEAHYRVAPWELLEPEIIAFLVDEPSPYKIREKELWLKEWREVVDKYKSKMFIRVLAGQSDRNKLSKIKNWFPSAPSEQLNLLPITDKNMLSDKDTVEDLIRKSIMDIGGYMYLLQSRTKKIRSVDLSKFAQKGLPAQSPINQPLQQQSNSPVVTTPQPPAPALVTNNAGRLPPEVLPPSNEVNAKSSILPQVSNQMSKVQSVVISKEDPPSVPKPIELKPVQPAEWKILPPPPELKDRTADKQNETLNAGDWYICGASRRGKLHENEGTFREDAFAVQYAAGWILVAVADGAGSHHLSRVGSNLSVKAAIETLTDKVTTKPPQEDLIAGFLENALDEAFLALSREAVITRKIDIRDLSTTLLLLMFHERKNLIGVAQVGDGLLAVQFADKEVAPLGNPESGEYSGQTYFLTNHQKGSFKNNVSVLKPDKDLKYFFVMTDGVADDLYPPTERLPGLIKAIPEVIASEYPDQALLELINYNRPGSFDDRTLVVVCKRQEIVKEVPAQEQLEPEKTVNEATAQGSLQTSDARPSESQSVQQKTSEKSEEEEPTVSSVSTDISADKINGKEQESSEIPSKPVDDTAGNAAGFKQDRA